MNYKEFGLRIKELRIRAGFSQRELADMVGINFTYLSKIESGAMPPPSEKVIIKIAEVLKTDKDELITLAGKIPSDIAQIVKDPEVIQSLRKAESKKKDKIRRTTNLMKYKPVYRVAIALMLVAAVATSLWFAAPTSVKALDIEFPSMPSTQNPGSTHSFTVKVKISDPDQILPIQSVDLHIYKADARTTYEATCTGLPLTTNTTPFTSITASGSSGTCGTISIIATGSNWQYGYGYGYAVWEGTPSYFGYGYGYGYGGGTQELTYSVNWISPSSWPAGSYKIDVVLTADSETYTKTSNAFTISAPSGGGGGGGGGGGLPAGVTSVSDYVTTQGVFRSEVTCYSADRNIAFTIPKDTVGLTSSGIRLSRITILEVDDPPAPPAGTIIVGLVYDMDPDGATFTPPATLTITYDPALITEGYSEDTLAIALYNEDTGEWTVLEGCILDKDNQTISVPLSHFTYVTVLAYPSPAEFTTGMLTISPTQVYAGESVSISTIITNTGLQEGTYNVTLRIDNAVVTTREVTLVGGESGTITFTVSRDAPGTYNVNVNGKTGSFTVKEKVVPPEPEPATFSVTGLIIYPTSVEIGESITIRASVANTGDLSGTYTATLKIDNVVVDTKDVTLEGGTSETVIFTTSRDTAGTYTISIDGQSDTFTIREAPEEPVAKQINWWLIGGIIAGVIAISIIVWLVVMHRRLEGYS